MGEGKVTSIIRDIAPAAEYWRGCYETTTDAELREKMDGLRLETAKGVPIRKRLPRVFGLAAVACERRLGLTPYPVQYTAAASLALCEIAQMNTGEGKTLTSILPACYRALDGKGVHVITVNEYLARRDFEMNAPVYELLGFSVGLSLSGMDTGEKQRAYLADITYSTATEAGFDYLRDGIAIRRDLRVQRGLYCAIVDEADSILLDEAVTPMILSGGGRGEARDYLAADNLVKHLKKTVYTSLEDDERALDEFEGDYVVDKRRRQTFLTGEGVRKAEHYYRTVNLFETKNLSNYHYILQALDAHGILERDVDYIVQDGKVCIVDRNTGRVMDSRRYSAGLHQAVEAKESLEIHPESHVLSTVTYQKYFMSYTHLSGMTGTAWQARRELSNTYALKVRRIAPNRPCIRVDRPDRFFPDGKTSLAALTEEAKASWQKERPVLIGTSDDRTSDEVSRLLMQMDVPHLVLSAKQNADEAAIIARAGMPGSVIVATNMAGRGTDIRLGGGEAETAERVRDLGGLLVLGAHRQRSRRVDDQLAGRAGRQGDPGESAFFVSPDDDLIKLFGDGKANKRGVRLAQARSEAEDANQRSAALETDTVLQAHRANFLSERNRLLDEPICPLINQMIERLIEMLIARYPDPDNDYSRFRIAFYRVFGADALPNREQSAGGELIDASEYIKCAQRVLNELEAKSPKDFDEMARAVLLQCADESWSDFLEAYEELKQGYRMMANGKGKPYITLIRHSADILSNVNAHILEEGLRRVFSYIIFDMAR